MARPRLTAGAVAALVAGGAFAAAGHPASAQRDERSSDRVESPAELLREYPFHQGRLRSRERWNARQSGAGATEPAASEPAAEVGGGGWPAAWLGFGVAAALLALALVGRRAVLASAGRQGRSPEPEPRSPNPASASRSARFPRRRGPQQTANSYAVANHKGGVGKTTVSLMLGAAAAGRGKRVLLVDLDPQASATSVLRADADERPTVANVMVDGCPLRETVVPTAWGIDLVPAEHGLRSADSGVPTGDEPVLGPELAAVAGYDLVLIDCPPSLGALTIEALAAASGALVVTEPTYLALHAMEELFDTLRSVRDEQNPSLELAGVVLNRVETTAEHMRSVAELEATFGPRLWEPHVPKRAVLQDAMREGVPPQDLETHSHYASEVAAIFDRLVERFETVKLKP
jgi:chromosome partitioning protein